MRLKILREIQKRVDCLFATSTNARISIQKRCKLMCGPTGFTWTVANRRGQKTNKSQCHTVLSWGLSQHQTHNSCYQANQVADVEEHSYLT